MQLALGNVRGLEVAEQPQQSTLEAPDVLVGQPDAPDGYLARLVSPRRERLVGRVTEEHRCERASAEVALRVDALQLEEARDPAVVLLSHGTNLARTNDADET